MPMVSVIVPVYMAEKYIERCVESILLQTNRDFELILIEDGSPDRSGEICDNLAATDSRIRVIHKENGGVSTARNAGLDVAKGEYVSFCDADDALPEDALEKMVCAMESNDTQLVVGDLTGVHIDTTNNKVRRSKSYIRDFSCVNIFNAEALHEFWQKNNMLSSCGKLYNRNIIEEFKVRFCTEMIVLEDYAFVIDYVSNCENLCMIPDSVYVCFSHAGVSAGDKRSRRDFFDDILRASKKLEGFVSRMSPALIEEYQQETIYYTLMTAYNLLWTVETTNQAQRRKKHKRIALAIQEERTQKMFAFYKNKFSRMEYFFLKHRSIWGVLLTHKLRNVFRLLL